ncbi:hypothetical protein KGF54_003204 [Candida jiufengensis]|uniref:uncharacterized protein n=1 Tax=Candida jiufengensis TaxID=497108 RepID=UPI002224306F|nr:uncharacterized protein KGF54_003204 [Candida jiufengensis]KAI5952338.1 hypothetical protein KGF54_003204 [Candida jiufengensis]
MSTTPPPAIFFTDWDGTVTLEDSNDYLTDNLGMGYPKRKIINDKILEGSLSFRDGFREMLESIPTPFNECIEYLLKNVKLDPGFKEFYNYCEARKIPIIVVSSGMTPIISALLTKLVGEEAVSKIQILSNDVRVDDNGKNWEIIFKHPDSHFGHDKSKSITEYLEAHGFSAAQNQDLDGLPSMPKLFYAGDGISDASSAEKLEEISKSLEKNDNNDKSDEDTDSLLFAKSGRDLIKFCVRENVAFTEFNDFKDILSKLKSIVDDGVPVKNFVENSKVKANEEVKETTK